MTTDSSQVMRVLDRCLDTAGPGSSTVPGVAAAAARAKTDLHMHLAISLLLAAEGGTTSWECAHHIMAAARESESGDRTSPPAGHCDSAAPGNFLMFHRCEMAAGEAESGDRTSPPAGHCDSAAPAMLMFHRCEAASRAAGGADRRTALALAGVLLAAIVVERSSLGTARSRQLRNLVAHGDVAAARTLWRNLADCQPGAGRQSGSRPPGIS
jgi:hypothetical protein